MEVGFSVCANKSIVGDDDAIMIKLSSESWELNIFLRLSEIEKLEKVKVTRWESGCLKIGMSAGNNVFWSSDGGKVSILVGHDDETWDFGVTLPDRVIDDIITDIGRELSDIEQGAPNGLQHL